MEQQTGFVEFDGRRIAYATVGAGQLLVMPSAGRGLPGTGLSDRERPADTLVVATVA